MIPGPFSICRISFPEDSDTPIYTTICYGYDSAEEAFDDISEVVDQEDIPVEELVVIQFIKREINHAEN
ncbi:hypothetical protein ES702_06274 [subsurface metagenome]